jgi:glycosyltransferase involved in cell wall biosynthesis
MPQLQVLLATYNGAHYIDVQLKTLLAQTVSDIEIVCSDDGSSDETLAILQRYRDEGHPLRILPSRNTGSAASNFFRLMEASTAPYVMLCDQDDFWYADKIERSLSKMIAMESAAGTRDWPILIHSQLTVADEQLKPIAPSLMDHQNVPHHRNFRGYLMQNNVTGCTTIMNRALMQALKVPGASEVIMHDWWLALIASALGEVALIDAPLALYRQHGHNTVGAKHWNASFIAKRVRELFSTSKIHEQLDRICRQAAAFHRLYGDQLSAADRQAIAFLADLPRRRWLDRKTGLLRHRLTKHGLLRNIALILTA